VQSGERTTLRKITMEESMCVAHPLSVGGAPGLACICVKGHLQVSLHTNLRCIPPLSP